MRASTVFAAPAATTSANCAQTKRKVGRAETEKSREQRDGSNGSEPGVIDDAVGDEAEADDDAQGAIDGSNVGFHISVWVRGGNVGSP